LFYNRFINKLNKSEKRISKLKCVFYFLKNYSYINVYKDNKKDLLIYNTKSTGEKTIINIKTKEGKKR